MTTMAATPLPFATVEALRINDLAYLAPGFRPQVATIVAAMQARGHPTIVWETLRLPRLQAHYFATGASHAPTVWTSWHGYGLAADLIHATEHWDASAAYWAALGEEVDRVGAAWGGHWTTLVDRPHVQFGPGMRDAPSDHARALVVTGGIAAVWRAVGALGAEAP